MIYRTNADELHEDEARAEARDLEMVVGDARSRRRRAAVIVAVMLVVATVAPVAFASARPSRPVLHCHNVQLSYENAPSIPAQTWTTCEWR